MWGLLVSFIAFAIFIFFFTTTPIATKLITLSMLMCAVMLVQLLSRYLTKHRGTVPEIRNDEPAV